MATASTDPARATGIEWPDAIRRRLPVGDAGAVRDQRTAAWLGIALGVSFTVCFATGLMSHWSQSSDPLIAWPARPAGLYRITQGVHVASGVASIPLLLAKLWVVLPRFFEMPQWRSIGRGLERLALVPLVGGGLFLLMSGVANIAAWYPWEFSFVPAHYWAAWMTVGGLVVHVGAQIHRTRSVLTRSTHQPLDSGADTSSPGLSRRGYLHASGALGIALAASVSAQTVGPLRRLGLLAPRDLSIGIQGLPVNSSAARRRVVDAATSSDYRLRITGAVAEPLSFTLDELRALPQHEAELPIACVEGWSKSAHWRGVVLRDLLARAGADPDAAATVVSLQERGGFREAFVNRDHAHDPDTLLALQLNGEELHLDHGYPVRLIGPNRPGVAQTKWVTEVRVS